jgi:PhnB protein
MAQAKPIPDQYGTVTAYLIVDGADAALRFYTEIFGGRERMRIPGPDGKIGHAEIEIGDTVVMLADEHPGMNARGPASYGGSPVSLHLYVDKVDEVVGRAVASGAQLVRPTADQFYGDRVGMIKDPFGHTWSIATHIEDVPPEELRRRVAAMGKGG